jgi:hypothetical protein
MLKDCLSVWWWVFIICFNKVVMWKSIPHSYYSMKYLNILGEHGEIRVFDEILSRENFAKLATKRFSCFAKMRDEFHSFVKLPRLWKKRVSRSTKIAKTKKTWSKNTKFNYFSFNSCEDAHLNRLWHSWASLNQNLTALNVNR